MAVILFDIDKTIFDTLCFYEDHFRPLLAKHYSLSLEESYRLIGDYRASLSKNTDFLPSDLCAFLSQHIPGTSEAELTKLFFQPSSYRQSVFPEVRSVLSSLQAKHTLGVFSEADLEWQLRKLELTGLKPFFDPELIFIFQRKETMAALSQLPAGAWIVDDRPEVIETLLEQKKFKPIWINRLQEQMPIAEIVPTITSIDEVVAIVS